MGAIASILGQHPIGFLHSSEAQHAHQHNHIIFGRYAYATDMLVMATDLAAEPAAELHFAHLWLNSILISLQDGPRQDKAGLQQGSMDTTTAHGLAV